MINPTETLTRKTTVRYTFTARELIEMALERLGAEAAELAIDGYNEADPTEYVTNEDLGISAEEAYEVDRDGAGLDVGIRSGVSMATDRGRNGGFAVKVNHKGETFVVPANPWDEAHDARNPLDMAAVTVQVRKLA